MILTKAWFVVKETLSGQVKTYPNLDREICDLKQDLCDEDSAQVSESATVSKSKARGHFFLQGRER